MKKNTILTGICAMIVCLVQMYSCMKPPVHNNPGDADNTYDGCRVKQITNQEDAESIQLIHDFTYNSCNDPVTVTTNQVTTSNPNLIFKYDDKNRLIEYSGLYSNGGYEFVHRYAWAHNRIETDTQYVFGVYSPFTYLGKRTTYIKYDNLDRIVQDSEVFVLPTPGIDIFNYAYDANGNRINGKTYDHKLNPHRTNKIWMFIDRDYSVNNSIAANTYNSAGLPLTFSQPNQIGFAIVFGYKYYYGDTQIKYDCK